MNAHTHTHTHVVFTHTQLTHDVPPQHALPTLLLTVREVSVHVLQLTHDEPISPVPVQWDAVLFPRDLLHVTTGRAAPDLEGGVVELDGLRPIRAPRLDFNRRCEQQKRHVNKNTDELKTRGGSDTVGYEPSTVCSKMRSFFSLAKNRRQTVLFLSFPHCELKVGSAIFKISASRENNAKYLTPCRVATNASQPRFDAAFQRDSS